jgi:cobalt-zinc-cadmium resistance protein CzcA
MIYRILHLSIHHRALVLGLTLGFAALGIHSFRSMVFDAFPDLTNVQVQVLTTAPGLGALEVERLVSRPVERSLGGAPGVELVRSLSRPGVSAVSVIFEDGTDPWLARQIVSEQIATARSEIPPEAGIPELGPRTTGLGEIYEFAVRSDDRSPGELYRLFEREIAPRLRQVPGVVEVNAWGAGEPRTEVLLDPYAMAARGIRWETVEERLIQSLAITAGGDIGSAGERQGVRAVSNPADPESLGDLQLSATHPDAPRDPSGQAEFHPGTAPIRLSEIAQIQSIEAPSVGLGTANGEGDALFVVVQLLAGADALRTVRLVRERMVEVEASLPPDVQISLIYDREKLVGSTLSTVARSLVEGGVLVVLVLLLLLGDLRAGLVVASVIPLSLLGAFTGLYLTGNSGNLMSLGAIDFGLVVDGTIVLVEGIVGMSALGVGQKREERANTVLEAASKVARPVLFAVFVLMLVYVPILTMVGTEGKLFRPMALTVLFALGTALVLTFTYVPALSTLIVTPKGEHTTALLRWIARPYRIALAQLLTAPHRAILGTGALIVIGFGAFFLLGIEFVPRLNEGDLVVQTARLPAIHPEDARREAGRVEQVIRSFPEVEHIAGRTGSPALATDPMGMEEADFIVRLRPQEEWTTAADPAGLVAALEQALGDHAPGADFAFTQPIEMRFNELLEGVPSDVGILVYGEDLREIDRIGAEIARVLDTIPGAEDVKAPASEGIPGLDVVPDPHALARRRIAERTVHRMVAGLQRGVPVGSLLRGPTREEVVMRVAPSDSLVDLPIVAEDGTPHTLGDVATLHTINHPALVRRQGGSRRAMVLCNVRGRDLGSFVSEAQAAVSEIPLPPGTYIEWSGKMEQLRAAAWRTAISVPSILLLIFGLLRVALGSFRPAALIFLNVPAATTGGILALLFTGQPLSMSAVVGFIALFGVAVMNGIVLIGRTLQLHPLLGSAGAARTSALERFRPVLMTAMVAGIGFLPMALATGIGAEVQRPLATVVIGGLLTATPLTLLLLPALYARFLSGPNQVSGETPLATDSPAE